MVVSRRGRLKSAGYRYHLDEHCRYVGEAFVNRIWCQWLEMQPERIASLSSQTTRGTSSTRVGTRCISPQVKYSTVVELSFECEELVVIRDNVIPAKAGLLRLVLYLGQGGWGLPWVAAEGMLKRFKHLQTKVEIQVEGVVVYDDLVPSQTIIGHRAKKPAEASTKCFSPRSMQC